MTDTTEHTPPTPQPELPSAADLQRLETLRSALLDVHRALLDAERRRYEAARGTIPNNSAFLQLIINDPWFDWLRPMAQLVLLIDERTSDKKQPLGVEEMKTLFTQGVALLRPDGNGDTFQRLFHDTLQTSPALAVQLRQSVSRLKG